jgi:hypothetical protein
MAKRVYINYQPFFGYLLGFLVANHQSYSLFILAIDSSVLT